MEDNVLAIAIANSDSINARRKHIDVRYHAIRERIINGDVILKHVKTTEQLADLLTKNIGPTKFCALREHIVQPIDIVRGY